MRIITWNVARRTSVLADQAAALSTRAPDVVALQEITARTLPLWRAACATIGLPHVVTSLENAAPRREPAQRRRTGVLVASRSPLGAGCPTLDVPWPETALAATVTVDDLSVDVHTVHVPNATNGWVKVKTLRAIRAGLPTGAGRAEVLCGDFNVPRRELPTGEVISFARDSRGRLRPERGADWDAAELGVVPGLQELGFRDAFRFLRGYESREPSWTWQRVAGHEGGWRLDHLFASSQLIPIACGYHHDWRDRHLSDHSALEADIEQAPR